jgi:hypothetical protein
VHCEEEITGTTVDDMKSHLVLISSYFLVSLPFLVILYGTVAELRLG